MKSELYFLVQTWEQTGEIASELRPNDVNVVVVFQEVFSRCPLDG